MKMRGELRRSLSIKSSDAHPQILSRNLDYHFQQPSNAANKDIRVLSCDYQRGRWVYDPNKLPMYGKDCPFHRNAWNCINNGREDVDSINSWRWLPWNCNLPCINPENFLNLMKDRRIGFIGDSLNENFLAALLCTLNVADRGAKKWKEQGLEGRTFPQVQCDCGIPSCCLACKI
ncbi:trichome birefringence-like 12 protein [Nymphaea thermarum]|nr:trichome birefringence-like 12 protein [Nymphaea thermarum]